MRKSDLNIGGEVNVKTPFIILGASYWEPPEWGTEEDPVVGLIRIQLAGSTQELLVYPSELVIELLSCT